MGKENWEITETTPPRQFNVKVNKLDLGAFELESAEGSMETWVQKKLPKDKLVFFVSGFGEGMVPVGAKDVGFDLGDGKQRYLVVASDRLVGTIRRSRPKERESEPLGEDVAVAASDTEATPAETHAEVGGDAAVPSDPEAETGGGAGGGGARRRGSGA